MGSESRVHAQLPKAGGAFEIGAGDHEVAQVAHWTPTVFKTAAAATAAAVAALADISTRLPASVKVIVTGGGFVCLEYTGGPCPATYAERRRAAFLEHLRMWTEAEADDLVGALRKIKGREFVVGVDVMVGGLGSGQFGLWVGAKGSVLVNKRFPVGGEAIHLAGVATAQRASPRVVETAAGSAMILVCHDAQAFHPRVRRNVDRAGYPTARAAGMGELSDILKDTRPRWVFNLIHSIEKPGSLRTFKTSFKAIAARSGQQPKIIGAFGHRSATADAANWLSELRHPHGMDAVTVVTGSPCAAINEPPCTRSDETR